VPHLAGDRWMCAIQSETESGEHKHEAGQPVPATDERYMTAVRAGLVII
jgi:hypothetical protein